MMNQKELQQSVGKVVRFTYGHRGEYLGIIKEPLSKDSILIVVSIIEYPNVALRDYLPLMKGQEVSVGNRNIKKYDGVVHNYEASLTVSFNTIYNKVNENLTYYLENMDTYRGREMYDYFKRQHEILIKHKQTLFGH